MSNEIKVVLNDVNEIIVKAERGVEGARGADGAEGPKGDGLEIISIYPTLLDLQTAHPIGTKGDCYAVGTALSNEVYFWDVDNSEWANLGSIMGPPGADGSIGADGKSAYEIALDNGFVGTEVEWLAGLKGADGADGLNGIDGTNGTNGSDGKSAYQSALDGGFVGTELEFNASLADVSNKQDALVSGTNIKTINGEPILGSGDLEIITGATYTVYTATIPNTSWTGSSAPFSKVVNVTGILATDYPNFDVIASGTYATDITRKTEWAKVYRWETTTDTITFYATSVPTVDLPLAVKVVR